MKLTAYKTPVVRVGSHDLYELIDSVLPSVPEGSIIAIAGKIVSLCEGRVVPVEQIDKDELIKQEAQQYLPRHLSSYNVSFTITRNMLLPTAGIDESNADGHYILWPKDLQASANAIRQHIVTKHGLQKVGVILTDSTTRAMQWGVTGVALAYSGFVPLKNYIGEPDIFGRVMQFETSSMSNGLAAAAVVMMGEGAEQTPIALIEDLPFIEFQNRNPTDEELTNLRIKPEDDLYWPLIQNAPWLPGDQKN